VPIRPEVPLGVPPGQQVAAAHNRRVSEPPPLASAAAPGITAPPKTTPGDVSSPPAALPAGATSSRPGSGRFGSMGGGGGTSTAPLPLRGLQPMNTSAESNRAMPSSAEENLSTGLSSSIPKTEAPLRLGDLEVPGISTAPAAATAQSMMSTGSQDSRCSSSASADTQSREDTTNVADSTGMKTVKSIASVGKNINSAGRRPMVPLPANVCKGESDSESEDDGETKNLDSVEVASISKPGNTTVSQYASETIVEKRLAEVAVHSAIVAEDESGPRDKSVQNVCTDTNKHQMEPCCEEAETNNIGLDVDLQLQGLGNHHEEAGLPLFCVDSKESEPAVSADGGEVSGAQMQNVSSADVSTSETKEAINGANVFSNPDGFPGQSKGDMPQILSDTNDETVSSSPASDVTEQGDIPKLNNHNTMVSTTEKPVAAAENDGNRNGPVHVVKGNEGIILSGNEAALLSANLHFASGTVLDEKNAAQSVSAGLLAAGEVGEANVASTENSEPLAAADQSAIEVTNLHPSEVHAVDATASAGEVIVASEKVNGISVIDAEFSETPASGSLSAVDESNSSHSGQGEHIVHSEISNTAVHIFEGAIVGSAGHISSDQEAGKQTAIHVTGVEESIAGNVETAEVLDPQVALTTDLEEEDRSTKIEKNAATQQEPIKHVAAGDQLSTAQLSTENATIVAGDPDSLGIGESEIEGAGVVSR
jgi:hypothetical protein